MKIILAHKYFYRRAGAETYLFDLMSLLQNHGHEVIPFSMHHPDNEKTPWSSYFVSHIDLQERHSIRQNMIAAARMIYSWEAKRKFEALVNATNPDVVHIQNIYHQISPSILDVCRKYNIPVVQTVHDYKLICPNYKLFANGQIETYCKGGTFYKEALHRCVNHSFSSSAMAALEMYIHKWLHIYNKGVRYWIAPSHAVKQILVSYGIPKERITTMWHPFDTTTTIPSSTLGKYILCAGRLSEEKGFDIMIRALQYLPGVRLKIAGQGPIEQALQKLVEREGVKNRVDFVGFVQGKALNKLMREASLVVVPSIWYEVFGYSIVEAMAMGKTVLGARIGAIEELLQSIDQRLLFKAGDEKDLADKARFLLEREDLRIRLGDQSRSWIQTNLFPEDYYDRLMQLYKKAKKRV